MFAGRVFAGVAVLAAILVFAPSAAASTPPAFGDCGRAAARQAYLASDMPDQIDAKLGPPPLSFPPAREFFLVRKSGTRGLWTCRDLNGDGQDELILQVTPRGGTASTPDPWGILEVPPGQTTPRAAFVRPDATYTNIRVRTNYVEERAKVLHRNDPNCCPSGRRVRFIRWTGTAFEPEHRRPPKPRPPDGPPDGYPGVPPPSGQPGCAASAVVGPIELRAACVEHRPDGSYAATGRIRVNGIDMVPSSANVEFVLNPRSLELSANGTVRVQVGPVVIYEGRFDRKLDASFTVSVPNGASLKGFPVQGEAKVKLNSSGAEIDANVAIEALGGVSGAAKLNATMSAGLRLDALSMKVGAAAVGPIPLRDVSLSYERLSDGRDRWAGGATLELPGPGKLASLTGSAAFIDGHFAEGFGELAGSVPVFPGITLTKVRAGLTLEPQFSFTGGMALSAGPRVLGTTAATIDGNFTFISGAPSVFKLTGNISVVRFTLAGGELAYRTNGQVTMAGDLNFTLAGVGFQGHIGGFVDGLRAFNVEGSGTVGFKGKGLGGEGLVSSRGAGACANIAHVKIFGHEVKISVGFGVSWPDFPRPKILAKSCGLGDWRVGPAARAAQTRGFRVRRGTPVLAISAVGQGGAPTVTLHGPGGITIPTPPPGVWTTLESGRLAFRNADDSTTYFAVAAPRAGRWTLTTEPGSVAVAQTRRANALPGLRIRARVRGHGRTRVLRWSIGRRAGRRVTFFERSGAGTRRIAVARGSHGRARFHPLAGRTRKRRIVALVEQGGVPQDVRTVARFRASTRRPGRPRRVHVRRRKHGAAVTWRRAAGASRYRVMVRISDGRRLLFMPRRGHRVVVHGVARRVRVVATVRGVDGIGRAGRPRRDRG
jgi:hypothetical protein